MSNCREMKDLLVRYAKARVPLITVKTDERARVLEILGEVAEELGQTIYCHTKSKGFYDAVSKNMVNEGSELYEAIDFIREQMKKKTHLTFALSDSGDIADEGADPKELYDLVPYAI